MSRAPAFSDWHQSLGPGTRRREALAWTGAALSVALLATATAALAMRLEDRLGGEAESEAVVFLDLAPEPPSSAAALPEFAPETPMSELPEPELEPEPPVEAPPELSPPPPDIRPPTDLAKLPDMALPPDSFSPEPPPPPPEPELEPEPEIAQIPDIRPRPRPELKPEPTPERRAEPERRRAEPEAPRQQRQASAPSASRAPSQAAVPQGQLNDLTARWGNSIRAKIQKRAVAPRRARGSVVIRLDVARNGSLLSAAIARSSGNQALDAAVLKAIRSAGRFAAAPPQLTQASYPFQLPIDFR